LGELSSRFMHQIMARQYDGTNVIRAFNFVAR
jgi:hypothetical protein